MRADQVLPLHGLADHDEPLQVRADHVRALQLEPHQQSPDHVLGVQSPPDQLVPSQLLDAQVDASQVSPKILCCSPSRTVPSSSVTTEPRASWRDPSAVDRGQAGGRIRAPSRSDAASPPTRPGRRMAAPVVRHGRGVRLPGPSSCFRWIPISAPVVGGSSWGTRRKSCIRRTVVSAAGGPVRRATAATSTGEAFGPNGSSRPSGGASPRWAGPLGRPRGRRATG